MTLAQLEPYVILRSVVGSTLLGLTSADGSSDVDEMGIVIEPIELALPTEGQPFEQFVYRTAEARTGNTAASSEPGDIDLTLYSLRKYIRLALNGNPTILLLLFAPDGPLTRYDSRGSQLKDFASDIISRRAGKAFLGYLHAQRQRLLGERGNAGHGRPRSQLIEKFGFDTKYAMHMVRLGLQGLELMSTGSLTLPMDEEHRIELSRIRNGEMSLQDILTLTGDIETDLKDLVNTTFLPPEPTVGPVTEWMQLTYFRNWSAAQLTKDIADTKRIREQFQFEDIHGRI